MLAVYLLADIVLQKLQNRSDTSKQPQTYQSILTQTRFQIEECNFGSIWHNLLFLDGRVAYATTFHNHLNTEKNESHSARFPHPIFTNATRLFLRAYMVRSDQSDIGKHELSK